MPENTTRKQFWKYFNSPKEKLFKRIFLSENQIKLTLRIKIKYR